MGGLAIRGWRWWYITSGPVVSKKMVVWATNMYIASQEDTMSK